MEVRQEPLSIRLRPEAAQRVPNPAVPVDEGPIAIEGRPSCRRIHSFSSGTRTKASPRLLYPVLSIHATQPQHAVPRMPPSAVTRAICGWTVGVSPLERSPHGAEDFGPIVVRVLWHYPFRANGTIL